MVKKFTVTVCDSCGKEGPREEVTKTPTVSETAKLGWHTISIGDGILSDPKNFCSSHCVKEYLDCQEVTYRA